MGIIFLKIMIECRGGGHASFSKKNICRQILFKKHLDLKDANMNNLTQQFSTRNLVKSEENKSLIFGPCEQNCLDTEGETN